MTQQRSQGWKRTRTDADRWNAKHKVGTPVRYYSVEGDAAHVVTTTRSDAFDTRQGVMIFLAHRGGSFLLSHVEPLECAPDELARLFEEEEARENVRAFSDRIHAMGAELQGTARRIRGASHVDFDQVRTELEKHFGDLVRGLEKAIGRLA